MSPLISFSITVQNTRMFNDTFKEKVLKARKICKAASNPTATQNAFYDAWNVYAWGDDDGTERTLAEKRALLDSCADAVLAEADAA